MHSSTPMLFLELISQKGLLRPVPRLWWSNPHWVTRTILNLKQKIYRNQKAYIVPTQTFYRKQLFVMYYVGVIGWEILNICLNGRLCWIVHIIVYALYLLKCLADNVSFRSYYLFCKQLVTSWRLDNGDELLCTILPWCVQTTSCSL